MDHFLVHLGYSLMLCALVARDIFWLRGMLVLAQSCIFGYALLHGLTGMAVWNLVFVLINACWALLIAHERRAAALPAELRAVYERHFSAMTPREFLRFWGLGEARRVDGGRLVPNGVHPHDLLFLLSGEAQVSRAGQTLARLPAGSFIAEMSLLTGQVTSADVDALGLVDLRAWPSSRIDAIRRDRPALWIKLQSVLGLDLVEKLKRAAPPAAAEAEAGSLGDLRTAPA